MVKYIICARRKSGMTRAEFSTYWRNQHGPLVRSVPEFMRHVRKYVQCHLVAGLPPLGIERTMASRSCGSIIRRRSPAHSRSPDILKSFAPTS
jgi:EthD domain